MPAAPRGPAASRVTVVVPTECVGWANMSTRSVLLLRLLPVFLLVTTLSLATACAQQDGIPSVNVTQLRDAMKQKGKSKVVVLDVRTKPELTSPLGKLDGIVHIPLNELSVKLKELSANKSDEIYVICRSGNRSVGATQFLKQQGYNAFNVLGGMIAWREKFGSAGK